MKQVYILILSYIFLPATIHSQNTELVSNVNIIFNVNQIEVSYDLLPLSTVKTYTIELFIYSHENDITPQKVRGDIGKNMLSGHNKTIVWDLQSEGYTFNEKIIAEIHATPEFHLSAAKYLLQSAVLPGLGNYKIGNGKMYALYGVAAYTGIATSVYFNQRASKSYSEYITNYDIVQSNSLYRQSLRENYISYALAGMSAVIWGANIYSVYRKTTKLKQYGPTMQTSAYYYDIITNSYKGRSGLTFIDSRTKDQIFVENGNEFFRIGEYEKALAEYQKASLYNPNSTLTKEKISQTDLAIAESKAKQKRYDNNKKLADDFFEKLEYQMAIIYYDSLLNIFPSDSYAKDRKSESNKKIEFHRHLKLADALFAKKLFTEAITEYEKASNIYHADEYCKQQINLSKKLIIDEEYRKLISLADDYLRKSDFNAAKISYNKAIQLKPNEVYPKTKIYEIESILTSIEQQRIDSEYNLAMQNGNTQFNRGNFEEAKHYYSQAKSIKPKETEPNNRINECNRRIEIDKQQKIDTEYRQAITSGDKAFENKEFDRALNEYEKAAKLKPSERYPKLQIEKINNIYASQDLPALFRMLSPAVFLIEGGNFREEWQGSGFFINNNGVAVSNFHVFEDAVLSKMKVKTTDGNVYSIERILAKDEEKDWIIFKVANPRNVKFTSLRIATKESAIGEDVFTIGNPKGLENTISRGTLSGYRDGNTYIQFTSPIAHGSSGGALFNMKGELIGVTTMGIHEGSLFFAINIMNIPVNRYK